MMFEPGTIWAYPTDTSFGLGVRADDGPTLDRLFELKRRSGDKYFSLMMRDFAMLQMFAQVPEEVTEDWFFQTPRTAILKPKPPLPKSRYWPEASVAFRVCTLPEIAEHIEYPITATSANLSGKESIFDVSILTETFGGDIQICDFIEKLSERPPSEIYDFTGEVVKRLR